MIVTLCKDLSLGGLRVLSPTPKAVSSLLSLEIDVGMAEEPLNLRAQVAWFQMIPRSDQFYLGLAFQSLSALHSKRLSSYLEKISLHPEPAKF